MTSEPVNYTWTRDSTKLLIALRSEYDVDFEDPTQRKIDVWERISLILRNSGYDFPPSICDKKWRNLLGSFRRSCSRSQGRNPRHPYTWEFYNDLVGFWQKKDPEGLKALNIHVEQFENGDEQDEDTIGDEMQENNGSYDENSYGQENSDEDGVGDMSSYLSVNLNEGEEDQEDTSTVATPCRLPYVPGLIIEETDMTCQSEEDEHANKEVDGKHEEDSSDHEFQNFKDVSLEATSSQNQLNRPRGRPYLPASVTIEELSTGIARPLRFKRKLPETSTYTNGSRNGSHDNFLLHETKPIISIHELPPDRESANKRFRENSSSPSDSNQNFWLKYMKEQEANAQRRWEITERRQAREAEVEQEMNKQIHQSLNKLTSVIALLVQRTGN